MTTSSPVLAVENVSIEFGGIKALTDVSFDVPPRGFTAVIGPNGAGKTTLFNCISGFYHGRGTLTLDGQRIDAHSRAERVRAGLARTFQTPVLLDEAPALDNVMLGAYSRTSAGVLSSLLGTPRWRREERRVRARAHELLERLGLAEVAGSEVGELPHGQRRLVEIGRALVSEPRVLLLDEPAAGTQHDEAVAMIGLVRDYCVDHDIAIVLVEHNVRLVMEFSADVVVLNFGSLLARGTPDEVRADPAVIHAYLGDAA